MPVVGERQKIRGYDSVWNGTSWQMDELKDKPAETTKVEAAEAKPAVPKPATPKVQSKGTSGLAETQTKSLTQILAEREEKKKKAQIIRDGGK
jgi:hypothetical protein